MKSLAELNAIKEKALMEGNLNPDRERGTRIVVGLATCGIAAGAKPVLAAFTDEVKKRGLADVTVIQTGCIGVCRLEPIAEVHSPGGERTTYVNMTAEKAAEIVERHIVGGNVATEYMIGAAE